MQLQTFSRNRPSIFRRCARSLRLRLRGSPRTWGEGAVLRWGLFFFSYIWTGLPVSEQFLAERTRFWPVFGSAHPFLGSFWISLPSSDQFVDQDIRL